jgi:UDP-N-acetylmuramate dehydrogenase
MIFSQDALAQLERHAGLTLRRGALLKDFTRFGLGGPAHLLIDAHTEQAFLESWTAATASGEPFEVIGGGSNLVVADEGFPGVVLRYTAAGIQIEGTSIYVEAGAILQTLVDASINAGLAGLHTMTGIPGWVGAAIYGNAGAYGHSISEFVQSVRFFDGRQVREITGAECAFRYRESTFKDHKGWIVLSAKLQLPQGDRDALAKEAASILEIRNAKYPPTMKCAGSIFKNLILAELAPEVQERVPAKVVREGKVPSAWFLEQAGAKGTRDGEIVVADYHANLIYNEGKGTAEQVRRVIDGLKRRVHEMFGLMLEEEVQFVGFGLKS